MLRWLEAGFWTCRSGTQLEKIYWLIFTFYCEDKYGIKKNFGGRGEMVGGTGRSPLP